jgi:hypothetical protein
MNTLQVLTLTLAIISYAVFAYAALDAWFHSAQLQRAIDGLEPRAHRWEWQTHLDQWLDALIERV